MNQSLVEELISVANTFGANPEYSRAGGGNASVKVDGILHIKPSGVSLATLAATDLVPLRIEVLLEALRSDAVVEGDPVRAAAEKAQVGDASLRRPSVEILFHALIPDALVLHTHPLVANALTCNTDAEALLEQLLGDEAVLVPYTNPGVPLAREVERVRNAYTARTSRPAPGITLLGNHGIIVSGNSAAELTERAERLTATIAAAIDSTPAPVADEADGAALTELVNVVAPILRELLGRSERLAEVTSDCSDLVRSVTTSPAGTVLLSGGPVIPDQIVYAGSLPLVLILSKDADLAAQVTAAVSAYRELHGKDPIISVVPGVVAFGAGADLAAAQTALATFTDALRVARDANRIGTVRCLDATQRAFIENWEAESYRKAVAAGA
jgi:rhamnose utilization protein RhaD (predicted bifunctional aldolase and dehydrogenase)